jgi:hypothetical protein
MVSYVILVSPDINPGASRINLFEFRDSGQSRMTVVKIITQYIYYTRIYYQLREQIF